jgi:hypothetical protein
MNSTTSLGSLCKRLALTASLAVLLVQSSASAATPPPPPKVHVFTAVTGSGGNTSGDHITLDHRDLNGKPGLKLIVTQYWTGVYNNHQVGVRYNKTSAKWEIANEDGAAMPSGANFNVLVPSIAQRVNAGPQNSYFDRTFFTLQQKNPDAVLQATHVIKPYTALSSGLPLPHNFGLFFIPTQAAPAPVDAGKWSVYREDLEEPLPTAYNVADVTHTRAAGVPISFRFSSTASNVSGIVAVISNVLTDNKPNAVLFVHHVYSATNSTLFDHPVGLSYASTHWRIFTEDQTTFPANVDFMVTAFPGQTP